MLFINTEYECLESSRIFTSSKPFYSSRLKFNGWKVLEYLPWCIEHDESGVHGLQRAVKVRVSEVDRLLGKTDGKSRGQKQQSVEDLCHLV